MVHEIIDLTSPPSTPSLDESIAPTNSSSQIQSHQPLLAETNPNLSPNQQQTYEPSPVIAGSQPGMNERVVPILEPVSESNTYLLVQSYVVSFSRHLSPPTYPHGFMSGNPTYFTPYPNSQNWNYIEGLSTSYSMHVIVSHSQQFLTPIPENAPFLLVSPHEEGSTNNNNTAYGFQMHANGATSSNSVAAMIHVDADADEEIDLELRLGRSQ
ncbi:hypothetical protein VNO78_26923 [Psophocarpus tetragonolobus]|uniref:Uncharacterized protein n=1 Tax=Psophocarpus tetragonolobus TaxID=3891 RepID=A0AAN9RZX9_PSOTE